MTEKDKVFKELAFLQVIKDGETINKYLDVLDGNIDAINMLPFYALFITETTNLYKRNNMDIPEVKDINKIRLSLKLFYENHNKNVQKILNFDENQNEEYKSLLRFDWMKRFNIHYNIGVYFDKNKNIISNTQFFSQYKLNEKSIDTLSIEELFVIGENIGRGIADCLFPFKNAIDLTRIKKQSFTILYKDYNSNRRNFTKIKSKPIALLLLHLISSINYILFRLHKTLKIDDVFLFKISYISYYYVTESLNILKNHLEQNKYDEDIKKTINSIEYDESYKNSDIRSCVMHYEFKNKNRYLIDIKYLSCDKPLFGLIETHFNGEDYYSVFSKITGELKNISNCLDNILYLDKTNLKDFGRFSDAELHIRRQYRASGD